MRMRTHPAPVHDSAWFVARHACPVCGSEDSDILFSGPYARGPVRGFVESHYRHQGQVDWRYLEGTDFVLSACLGCDSLYQKHVPNAFLLDNVYNVMIAQEGLIKVAMGYLTVDSFEAVAGELATLFRLTGKPPGEIRFLDYGLGYGRWGRVAAAMGARVFATEISPEKIAFARALGIEIVTESELRRMRFTLIHTEQVFEHLTEPGAAFAALAQTLEPEGIFKVAIPPAGGIRGSLAARGMIDASPLEYRWHSDAGTRRAAKHTDYISVIPLEHLNVFSAKAMRMLADRNGVTLISTARRAAVPVSFLNGQAAARSLLQAAKVMLRPVFRRDSGYYLFRR